MLQPEEIGAFAAHLRREGYKVSLYQVLAAQEVAGEESRQGSTSASLVRLATLLRPIFCSTPEEQERFEQLYLAWLRARSDRAYTIPVASPTSPPPDEQRTHWRMKLAAAGLLILPALTAWFLCQDLRTREAVGRVMADGQPVVHATVRLGERTVTTDEQGRFKVPFKNNDMPLQLLVETKGYFPSQLQVGQTILENRKWFYLSLREWDAQYQIDEVQLARETGPISSPSLTPAANKPTPLNLSVEEVTGWIPSWLERLSYFKACVALAPSLLVLMGLLYRFSRRAVLKRQSGNIPPKLSQIQIQAGMQRLFPSLSMRHVTQRLRQRRFEESTELDVARTIHHTINHGGLFTPICGSKREPGYVALIDRATVADHQANAAAQVVKDLAKGYVLLRQYEFDEQPTILRKVDPLRAEPKHNTTATVVAAMVEVTSLGEVRAKLPTSRLLCFTDPITCFDPLTGKLRPWVETLEAWEERFLFTTRTHGQYGQAEQILTRRGFQVIPLSHLGIRLFSQLVEEGRPPVANTNHDPREPWGIYDRTPHRWLERHPPSQDTIARLMKDLRTKVGPDGIRWLAACAAYPEIHWALTLEWGLRLFGHGHTAESLLPKITPLVWLRHAFMPDWFRTALYDQLTPLQADRISQELRNIISALNPNRKHGFRLYIATQPGANEEVPPGYGRYSEWFQKLRLRLRVQQIGQAAEPGSPMRDYVMLQFLSGRQGKALTPYIPKVLLKLLFPKGQPWLGFRPLFVVIVTGLVSTGLWWSLDPSYSPIVVAGDICYTMKRGELQIAQLEEVLAESTQAKGMRDILATRQEIKLLENKYDKLIKEIGLYANISEQDRAVFRVARLFGECEVTMPKDFLAEVHKYIQKWKTTDRLVNGIRRALTEGYAGTISNAMFTNNLPAHFLYLALQESGLDSKAVGPKTRMGYAKGMWQLVPSTAKEYGLKPGPLQDQPRYDPEDDRFNAKMATEAAAKYIRRIYLTDAQASGLLVIASYNWGDGNVTKMIRQLPKNPQERNFWQLLEKFKIPQETYDYVFYIIAAAVIGENPQLFGFSFPAPFPVSTTTGSGYGANYN